MLTFGTMQDYESFTRWLNEYIKNKDSLSNEELSIIKTSLKNFNLPKNINAPKRTKLIWTEIQKI